MTDEQTKTELKELEEHLQTQQIWSKPKIGKFEDAHFFGDFV